MKDCCRAEANRSLRRHRDAATCDRCGALLLAYGNQRDFARMVAELERRGASYATEERENLRIVVKHP